MTPAAIYAALLSEIDDALERKVFQVLADDAGEQVSRPDMVFRVFGVYVQQSELGNNKYDRQVRECIAMLRKRGYPIVSTSGGRGYKLTTDHAEINSYIAEQVARRDDLETVIRAMRGAFERAATIREYRATKVQVVQPGLFQ